MSFGLLDTEIEKIKQVFETNTKVDKAFVFGSRAKGNYKEGSDIDIAIKGNELNFNDVRSLVGKLDELNLIYDIDLLDYAKIKEPALKEHIDRVGIEFYSRWKEYRFSELLIDESISYGIVQPGTHTEIDSVPIIRVNNIKNGKIITDEIMKVSSVIEEKYLRTRLIGGELLITVVGSVGECAIVPESLKGWNVARAVSVARIKKDFNVNYIKYAFKTDDLIFQMYGNTNDTVQPTLNLSLLKELKFSLPSFSEQTAIATILSSLDDKIDLLHRQNKTLEQLAETLFRQWFVEEVEESWEEKSLPEIADYLNGLALQKFPAKIDYLPVIKIREMKQGLSENTDKCSSEIPIQYVVQDGDVLFSWSGSLEVVLWSGGKGALNQHLFKVTSKVYPKWFYYLATKHHLNDFKTIAESKSTTMGHIQKGHLNQAMISIPPKEMFNQYDERIAPIIDKQIENHKQIRSLTQTRDALLPKLMSGEVRVEM
jgi:type I restriction enzyme, S subunit